MSAAFEALTSIASGGLIGAVGGVASKWLDGRTRIKEMEMKNKHELALAQQEQAMAELQMQHKTALVSAELEHKVVLADLESMVKSYEHDQASYATVDTTKTSAWFIFVDVMRGITRPGLTWFLVAYMGWIVGYTLLKYGVTFAPEELQAMTREVVRGLLATAMMAVSWWFGARSKTGDAK